MSHEFCTAMNGVLSGCELLMSNAAVLTSEQVEILSMLHVSAQSMLVLINDVLGLSRLEAQNTDYFMRHFDARMYLIIF